MRLVLLDRDGVVTKNRQEPFKSPAELDYVDGTIEAIARSTAVGVRVGICTNQSEIAKGVIDRRMLSAIHCAMLGDLAANGADVDLVLSCVEKCPRGVSRNPACCSRHCSVSAHRPIELRSSAIS